MLGKPEWFKRRKYGGWGLVPKTWQGGVYIAVFLIPFLVFQLLPFWSNKTRTIVTVVWLILLLIDTTDIMIRMKKDERERIHEAIADRNAAWFMVLALAIGFVIETVINGMNQKVYISPTIVVALLGGVIVKAVSNLYLEKKA